MFQIINFISGGLAIPGRDAFIYLLIYFFLYFFGISDCNYIFQNGKIAFTLVLNYMGCDECIAIVTKSSVLFIESTFQEGLKYFHNTRGVHCYCNKITTTVCKFGRDRNDFIGDTQNTTVNKSHMHSFPECLW